MLSQIITHFAHGPKEAPVHASVHSPSLGEQSTSNGTNFLAQGPQSSEIVSQQSPSSGKNYLTHDVEITGSLRFSEELVFDGKIEGDILSEGHLVVGGNARIKGNIETRSITVYGIVVGNIKVLEHCELMNGSVLLGELTAATVAVEEGATFNGRSHAGKCAAAEAVRLASESAQAELALAKTENTEPSHLQLAYTEPAQMKPTQIEPVFSEPLFSESQLEVGMLVES